MILIVQIESIYFGPSGNEVLSKYVYRNSIITGTIMYPITKSTNIVYVLREILTTIELTSIIRVLVNLKLFIGFSFYTILCFFSRTFSAIIA